MKVGKKLLSTLLAVMMIISSVSVCFGVLGADNSIDSLMNQIDLHYANLIDLIGAANKKDANGNSVATEDDLKMVIASDGVGGWKVERDTAYSSWHWVTKAYAEAAKSVASDRHTYMVSMRVF